MECSIGVFRVFCNVIRTNKQNDTAFYGFSLFKGLEAVSYTHLDVYKRQGKHRNRAFVLGPIEVGVIRKRMNDKFSQIDGT